MVVMVIHPQKLTNVRILYFALCVNIRHMYVHCVCVLHVRVCVRVCVHVCVLHVCV